MADPQQPIIIIRRKKKGGHAGHHGGAWKVAYADFVTAMMAFFLLLWLLNVTTDTQRRGLADYFAPAGISKSTSGAGGMFGGMSIASPTGAQFTYGSPPTINTEVVLPTRGEGQEGEEDTYNKSTDKPKADEVEGPSKSEREMAAKMKAEEERFKKVEESLKTLIDGSPALRELARHLLIDRTREGLRIQIIDHDNFSMFPSGSSMPYEKGRDLLRIVGAVVARLPNYLSVTGHTDSTPFPKGSRQDNWSLSTDRANVSRREMVFGGVDPDHIARVVGMAGREPLVPSNEKDSRNRRISIVLLRDDPTSSAHEAKIMTKAVSQETKPKDKKE